MGKRTVRLTVIFSFSIFLLFAVTMFISISAVLALLHFGVIAEPKPQMQLACSAIISIFCGTLIARLVARRAISSIVEISEAAKQVSKGNFDVRLSKRSHVLEIDEMAQNFELMAQELSGIETFRGDFINNVSHELKTPLAAVEGYGELLKNRELDDDSRELYLDRILYNVRRLSSLTGNILQLSRLENQEILQERALFSLDEQIRQEILLFGEAWSEKKLRLDVELDDVNYIGNQDLLSQVWQNLIGNAVKFTDEGGRIGIFLSGGTEFAEVRIEDSGIGMDKKTQRRIFEKFYQGDTSHSSEGNGLGLALVKRIVDLHGGVTEVRSAPGEGSCFRVRLPLPEG